MEGGSEEGTSNEEEASSTTSSSSRACVESTVVVVSSGSGGGGGGSSGIGLTRRHSVPLVNQLNNNKFPTTTTTTTTPLSDVIINGDVIAADHHHHLSDVITTEHHPTTTTPGAGGVTIHHPSDEEVTLGGHKTSIIVKQEGGPSLSSSTATKIITLSTTTSTSSKTASTPSKSATTTATFHLEPDWREAALDPVLSIRCKKTTAELVKRKFGSGSRGKCIRLGKQWFTPTEFEAHCGRSASKDWKRSIRFQGQSLLTLVEEGYLQVHATSCSCGACLDDDAATGSVRLHRPYKRKKRDRFFLETDKTLKQDLTPDHASPASATPTTVTLPVSGLGDLTVVPGILMGEQTAPDVPTTPPGATTTVTGPTTAASTLIDPNTLPLDKAWEHMNEVLLGLERSVGEVRVMLGALKERCQQEGLTARHKLLQEKEEAVNQAKLEAHLSTMAKSSEGFLVQVREDDGASSLQPIMLDSLISSVPSLSPAPPLNGVRRKCVNCNRESELECSGCQGRNYCGDFCQRRDWVNHQSECGRATPTSEDPLSVTSAPPGYIFMLSD